MKNHLLQVVKDVEEKVTGSPNAFKKSWYLMLKLRNRNVTLKFLCMFKIS